MDLGDSEGGFDAGVEDLPQKKRALPADLPRSLDDRRHVPADLVPETEMYDGWQGECPLSRSPHVTAPSYRWPWLNMTLQDNHSSCRRPCSPSP
jgi:hypothetical protein